MTTMVETENKSRWGYHACNYENFKKIKLLHKHYWLAKVAEANHIRFYNKQPQNRVVRKRNKILLTTPIPMKEPFFPSVYNEILKKPIVPFYQQARHPQPCIEMIKPLIISMSQVNDWLSEIEQAHNNKK